MEKTNTLYIKCSEEEAAAIRAAAKKQQRTIHSYLRVIVLATLGKRGGNDPLTNPGLCIPYEERRVTHFPVGAQDYLVIPVKRDNPNSTVWQALPETGIKIVTKRAIA
jgi:hypothetical protein